MSVENYLESIRKNTANNSTRTSKLDSTIKDLLNYEALKRAVSAGVEKGNQKQFERLAELSSSILESSSASVEELKEINALLKLFYEEIPKNSNGNAQLTTESWVKALVEVLDEFGDKLPDKFQKRLKYDVVSAAADAGANPNVVMQQLNVTQINQVQILQNIYSNMTLQQKLIERKAEAQKPIENQEKREQKGFWDTKMGKVLTYLSGIFDHITGIAKWAGLIAVGVAIWSQLKESLRNALQGLSGITLLMKGGFALNKIFPLEKIGSSIAQFLRKSVFSKFFKDSSTGAKAETGVGAGTKLLKDPTAPKQLTLFDTEPYLGAGTGKVSKLSSFFKSLGKIFKPLSSILKGAGKLFGIIGKFLPMIVKVAGKIAWPIQVFASTFDFIKGFMETEGSTTDKIIGGLKNVIVQFVSSIWALLKAIPGLLWKAFIGSLKLFGKLFMQLGVFVTKLVDNIRAYFQKGWWDQTTKLLKNAISSIGDALKTGLLQGIAGILDEIISGGEGAREDSIVGKIVAKVSEWRSKIDVPNTRVIKPASKVSFGDVFGSNESSMTVGFSDSATGTDYMGKDAYSAALPMNSYVSGTLPANAAGIKTSAGVRLSSQSSDFIKRAGLTDTITSGTEGRHQGNASNPRSHYSGNKFDVGMAGKNATQLASTLEKLLRTPGLLEAHVEGATARGDRESWKTTYSKALAILKSKGFSNAQLSKIGWWGAKYSSGKHIDVLIDPKKSGVTGNIEPAQVGISQSALSSASDTGTAETNPLLSMMKAQLVQVQNEMIAYLKKGIKSPDQLTATQNKAATSAITSKLAEASKSDSVTFNKKTDITDPSLASLYLFDFA